ncbi:tektin-4-like [Sander lucioperca]|uniref:tektin-4-like n=1 Tax=Sander lucioperca TaxID=283035 RepID=UPI00125D680F|nr:tektin-4-like [Sander lucioperca]
MKPSEVLVSRPHYDRAVAQGVPVRDPHVEPDVPQPSSGSATAGYRSTKYYPAEWFSNYRTVLQQAGTNHHEAQSIQSPESKTLHQDTEAATLKTQAVGTRLLGERLQETHYWKSELKRHVDKCWLLADTESLLALKTRLEKALDATETPFAIATDNLNCRARRPGADLVRDTVEEELVKEVDLIRSIQALLKRTRAQVVTQFKMNREAKQTLELDWSDKYQAYNFDDHSGRYSNMSPDMQHHPSSATLQDP